MTQEEVSSLCKLVPSFDEQSPVTTHDFHIAPYHTKFLEDPFTEAVIPSCNPPLTDPSGPVLVHVPLGQDISSATPIFVSQPAPMGSMPMETNSGSPPSSPPAVSYMPMIGNPSS